MERIIIDISKEMYEAYKGRPPMFGDEGLDSICQAIANGTPLDIVLDDIWLLYQRHQSHLATYVYEFGVELNELLHRYWSGGEKFTRSQGEWEKPFRHNDKTYHRCTKCRVSSELILIDNFCPNCGAKMKGGEGND